MSYTNTTTHFNWPLPEETDLFNGLDDNQMKEDLDEKIYNLEQQSTGDHEAVTQLNGRVTEVEQTVGGYDTRIEELGGTVGEHAERLINLTNRQTELSRRLNGKAGESTIAAEYNEEETYVVGDFVYYANILYKCAVASATPAGEFDSDNWDIVILTNELGGSTTAANVSFDDTAAQLGANNAQDAIVALKILNDDLKTNVADVNTPAIHTMDNTSGAATYTPLVNCLVICGLNAVTGIDPNTGQPSQSANKTSEVAVTRNGITVASHSVGNNYYAIPYSGYIIATFECKAGDIINLSARDVNAFASTVTFYELT